jgi:hypothetical protein
MISFHAPHRGRSLIRHRCLAIVPLFALALAACAGDATAPSANRVPSAPSLSIRPADELTFLRPAADAPTISNPVVRFYAKVGDERQARMYYHLRTGALDSTRFVKFGVGRHSLFARPDGTRFAPGDSVLITLTLSDPERLTVDFQPTGLRFSALEPAELEISYLETDPDRNGDGVIDAADTAAVAHFRIWRREPPSTVWTSQPSQVRTSLHEVRSFVFGFTAYAVAY